MPYNGSGGFSLAQSAFLPNTVISSSEMNSDLSDIATNGLTNAVTKDGQTTITAPFKGASGSVGLPMYSFAADPDGGMYRIGANNIGISVNATKILDIATTGLTVTGTFSADVIQQAGASLLPAGVIVQYGGTAAPTGWLLCNGASVLRATYPDLFTAIGTTYGSVDGTHFTLPDSTGRVLAGKESVATRLTTAGCGINGATLGAAGGGQNVTLTNSQLPITSLTFTGIVDGVSVTSSTSDILRNPSGLNFNNPGGGGGFGMGTGSATGFSITSSGSFTPSGTVSGFGGGTSHSSVQPTLVVTHIIKT